jgi:hypothetical protein
VRRIIASIFCSARQLIANATPAKSPMAMVLAISAVHGTTPGVERNMTMTARKTANYVTLGFVSPNYRETRKPKAAAQASVSGV